MKKQIIITGMLLFSLPGFAQQKACQKDVDPEQFQQAMDSLKNEIIIDVRPTDMFKSKIIPHAVFVPSLAELNVFADSLDKETPILVYCAIGIRSKKVCEILCEKEFRFVVNLKDGIEGWKKQGLMLENPQKE